MDEPKQSFDVNRNTENEFVSMCVDRLKKSNEACLLLTTAYEQTTNELERRTRLASGLHEIDEREKAALKEEKARLTKEVDEWKSKALELEKNEKTIDNLRGERDEATKKMEENKHMYIAMVANLTNDKETNKKTIGNLSDENAEMKESMKSQDKNINTATTQLEEDKNIIANLTKDKQNGQKEIKNLTEENAKMKESMDSQDKNMNTATNQLEEDKNIIANLTHDKQNGQKEIENLTKENAKMREAMDLQDQNMDTVDSFSDGVTAPAAPPIAITAPAAPPIAITALQSLITNTASSTSTEATDIKQNATNKPTTTKTIQTQFIQSGKIVNDSPADTVETQFIQTEGEKKLQRTLLAVRGEKAILKERNHKLEIRCLDFKYDANAYEKLLEACRCNLNLERRKERRHRNDVIRKQENNFKRSQKEKKSQGHLRDSDLRGR